MLTTFIISSGLITLSILTSLSPLFTFAGAIGCTLSSTMYISDIIHKQDKKIFTNCKLINKDNETPTLINKTETENKLQLIYSIPTGLSFDDFVKQEDSLSTAFKMPLKVTKCNNYNICLEVIKNIIYTDYSPVKLKPYELLLSENIIINMNKFPHCLIGGDTGSGKSRLILTILTNLIHNHKNIDIHLLQVRKNDLGVFKNCKQVKTFSTNLETILENLIKIDMELQRREKLIDNYNGIYNIEDYNHSNKIKKLNYIYIVVDEFSFLNISRADSKDEKLLKQQCLKYIKTIINIGRSSGVFLITSLQKPTADSIPSDIKSQLVTRVSMKIQDIPTSIVIIGTDEATKLTERQLIVKTNKTQFDYSFSIEHNIIKKYIEDSIVIKPNIEKVKLKSSPETNQANLSDG